MFDFENDELLFIWATETCKTFPGPETRQSEQIFCSGYFIKRETCTRKKVHKHHWSHPVFVCIVHAIL